jgi:hypothetical protein
VLAEVLPSRHRVSLTKNGRILFLLAADCKYRYEIICLGIG